MGIKSHELHTDMYFYVYMYKYVLFNCIWVVIYKEPYVNVKLCSKRNVLCWSNKNKHKNKNENKNQNKNKRQYAICNIYKRVM